MQDYYSINMVLLGLASHAMNRYIRVSCGFRNRRHHREDDRDCLIEDDATSTRTENIMMSGLSQTSFTSASTTCAYYNLKFVS